MIFFTVLIGVCVAIQAGVLKPVDHQKSVVSLIQTAKTDPHALIQMLEGADKETLKSILKLLNELRTESIDEQKRLTTLLANAAKNLAEGKAELSRLNTIKAKKKAELDEAVKQFNIAHGTWVETKQEYDDGSPRLRKEIGIFLQVIQILNNLVKGQPQPKGLLELGASAEGQVYSKMIENIKADPVKLKKVIAIVTKLLGQSRLELQSLKQAMDGAKAVRDDKERIKNTAFGEWRAASAAVAAQEAVVQQLTGAFQEATREHGTNYPIVTGERKTIEEVIKILNDMLKAQG